MYSTILYEIQNNVATITINRPEVSNAFSLDTYKDVKSALDAAGADDSVRAVVLTGVGKNFSAGGDIQRFKMLIETEQYLPAEGVLAAGAMSRAVRMCPKPVIAMINGAAAGAGASLSLACDFRVGEANSKIVMAFVNMGFPGDTGGIYFLNRLVGMAKTTEMLALGTVVKGLQAYEWGLINRLAEDGKLAETTYALAQELANKPTVAIGLQKKLYYEFFYNDLEKFNDREAKYMMEGGRTADHKEAVFAFLEKRKPEFQGR